MALLALHLDEQERAYQEIKKALPDGRTPTIDELPKLSFVEAVLNETLRMFPAIVLIPRMSVEDTTLPITNSAGDKVTGVVSEGTSINIHTPGLQRHAFPLNPFIPTDQGS